MSGAGAAARMQWMAPRTAEDASELIAGADGGARAVAGCTQVTPRALLGDRTIQLVVDLLALDELRDITSRDDMLRVGAGVSMRALATSPVVAERAPILHACGARIGDEVLQRHATVGGNVALRGQSPVELATVLVALGAYVNVCDRAARRRIDADALAAPAASPHEILCSFDIATSAAPWAYRKLTTNARAYTLASVAVVGGRSPRVVVNAGSGLPHRLPGLEAALASEASAAELREAAARELAGVSCPTDVLASGAYRRHALGMSLGDALVEVAAA